MKHLSHRKYVATLLPTNAKFEIDEEAYRRHLRYFTRNERFARDGGLVINPEAGETFYMTREEKRRTLEIALEEANGKLPVFAGIYGATTRDVVELTKDAKAIGAQGIFVIPPGGAIDITLCWDPVKYPEVWLDQIKEQDRAVDLPMITHPVATPSAAYGGGLPVEPMLKMIKEVPNIVGWKMTYSYEGYRRVTRALREHAPNVAILAAPANIFHENLASGEFDGTVSGSWCYALESMLEHLEAWEANDVVRARKIWHGGLSQLHDYIYSEWGRLHVRYKAAAWLRGLVPQPAMRPPMPAPRREELQTLHRLLKSAGMSVIDEASSTWRAAA
jgi:4-hydroxy-tetrahydrodipicolinate synthase